MKNMTEMTITHTTTDLGLWWPYTDQGKTPWRNKQKKNGENYPWGKNPIQKDNPTHTLLST